jgi:hypothetical protein
MSNDPIKIFSTKALNGKRLESDEARKLGG